jgi:hypothetical protein
MPQSEPQAGARASLEVLQGTVDSLLVAAELDGQTVGARAKGIVASHPCLKILR